MQSEASVYNPSLKEFEDSQDRLIREIELPGYQGDYSSQEVGGSNSGCILLVLTNWCKEVMRLSEFLPIPHLPGIQPVPSWRGLDDWGLPSTLGVAFVSANSAKEVHGTYCGCRRFNLY